MVYLPFKFAALLPGVVSISGTETGIVWQNLQKRDKNEGHCAFPASWRRRGLSTTVDSFWSLARPVPPTVSENSKIGDEHSPAQLLQNLRASSKANPWSPTVQSFMGSQLALGSTLSETGFRFRTFDPIHSPNRIEAPVVRSHKRVLRPDRMSAGNRIL